MGTNFLLLPRIVHTSKLKIGVFRTDWIPDLPTPRIALAKGLDVHTGAMTSPTLTVQVSKCLNFRSGAKAKYEQWHSCIWFVF